jgi:hypothetical protein
MSRSRSLRRLRVGLSAVAAIAIAAAAAVLAGGGGAQSSDASSLGPEGVPVPCAPNLAPATPGTAPASIDGVRCLGDEQLVFHIHAHLALFVDGAARRIPYGIGIKDPQVSQTPAGPFVSSGSCFYWLHTHAADGIIHIESPIVRTYTLGDFFDVWDQRLSRTQVGPASGRVSAFYNGRRYEGDPRAIPLRAHAQIQLEVGTPRVPPMTIAFPQGL